MRKPFQQEENTIMLISLFESPSVSIHVGVKHFHMKNQVEVLLSLLALFSETILVHNSNFRFSVTLGKWAKTANSWVSLCSCLRKSPDKEYKLRLWWKLLPRCFASWPANRTLLSSMKQNTALYKLIVLPVTQKSSIHMNLVWTEAFHIFATKSVLRM